MVEKEEQEKEEEEENEIFSSSLKISWVYLRVEHGRFITSLRSSISSLYDLPFSHIFNCKEFTPPLLNKVW